MTRCQYCHCVGRHLIGCPDYREMTTSWKEIEALVNVQARFLHGRLEWSITSDDVLRSESDLAVEDALHEELKREEGARDDD